MSYILEALRKSERERRPGHITDLTQLGDANTKTHWTSRAWRIVPWLLALVALALWWSGQNKPLGANETGGSDDHSENARQPATAPRQAAVSPVPQHIVAEPPVSEIEYEDIRMVKQSDLARQQRMLSEQRSSGDQPDADNQFFNQVNPGDVSLGVVAGRSMEGEAGVGSVVEEPVSRLGTLGVDAAPLLMEMDLNFRRSVPSLSLDVHVYSENPLERFVFINMRKYKEGEQLREGMTLEAILENGVVLNQEGNHFRLLPE